MKFTIGGNGNARPQQTMAPPLGRQLQGSFEERGLYSVLTIWALYCEIIPDEPHPASGRRLKSHQMAEGDNRQGLCIDVRGIKGFLDPSVICSETLRPLYKVNNPG